MLAIPLFGGEHACVDEKHFDELAKFTWHLSSTGYVKLSIKGKNIKMSRMIMNAKKGEVVDHVNGNILLNTETNLRICTRTENNMNTKIRSNNTSGHKGVSLDKRSNKWRVTIGMYGNKISIGYFEKLEDAIEASKAAYAKYHGEFSYLEREEVDMTEFYMAKWHPKSIELFAKKQEPKSSGILNLIDLTVAISTTQDKVAIVDLFDYNLVSQYKWCAAYDKDTNSYYAVTGIKTNDKRLSLGMHRLITDAQKGDIVDHKNGVTMDNRGDNLRITDKTGNTRNAKVYSNNKSGVPGVCYDQLKNKWVAYYTKDKKHVQIGAYNTKEEAVDARLAVVTVEYGEFLRSS